MRIIDVAWAAGILEGEGCFVTIPDKRRLHTISGRVQLEMTDLDVIERFNNIYPSTIHSSMSPSKLKRFPNGKQAWRWALGSKSKIKALCQEIYPFMSIRRKIAIDELLKTCEFRYGTKVEPCIFWDTSDDYLSEYSCLHTTSNHLPLVKDFNE